MSVSGATHVARLVGVEESARPAWSPPRSARSSEAGEIAEKVKKLVHDRNSDLAQLDRDDMASELGDVLWYTAVLANFLGLSPNDVAQRNVDKLADRRRRSVLGGSGDNR